MPINYNTPPVLHSAMVHAEPQGNLTGASVHEQLLELDTEKFSISGAFMSGYKNKIINGDFSIAQRGTSFSNPAGIYTFDRWKAYCGNGTATISRNITSGGMSGGRRSKYYYTHNQTGASTNSKPYLIQKIEDVGTLQNGKATLSFLSGASKPITVGIQVIQEFGTGGSPSSGVNVHASNINLSTSFQLFSITFDVPSIVGKTLGSDNNHSLWIEFDMPMNDTYIFYTAGVQLEEGSVATPFEARHIAQELMLCLRYYEARSGLRLLHFYPVGSDMQHWMLVPFLNVKRAIPSISSFSYAPYGRTTIASTTNVTTSSVVVYTSNSGAAGGLSGADNVSFNADAEL